MAALGDRITSAIDALRQRGLSVSDRIHKGDTVYTVTGSAFHVIVTVNPTRWIGLHFGLGQPGEKSPVTYDIDAYLYDLASPRFDAFAQAIEGDIVAFLNSLAAGRIRVGKVGRKPALLVPVGKRTFVVTRGRFVRSVRIRRAGASLEAKGAFTPVS